MQLAVNKELEDLKNALKRETATDDLKTRGITLAPDDWQRKGMRLGDEDGMLPIDPFEHQTEPCHAAIITDAGAITYVCTEPKRHGWGVDAESDGTEPAEGTGEPSTGQSGPETSAASGEPTGEDKPRASKADAEAEAAARAAERKAEAERARVEALRDAEQARRTTLRTALKGKLTKDMERHIYWQVLNAAQVDHDVVATELLDLPAADGDESPLRTFASKSDESLKKAAFAVLAMLAEGPLQGKNPNFEHETVPQHYQTLSSLGYTPTPVERDALGSDDQASADVA